MIDLSHIIALLLHYKYALLFPIAFVEGPIVSVLGGFLASTHHLNVYLVYLVVLLGDLIADTIYYIIGRYGGRRVLNQYGRFSGLNSEQVDRLQTHFQKHTGKTLFAGKFAHGLGTPVLIAAGIAQVRYRKFMVWNLLSASLKSLILVTIGYYYGYAYQRINDYLGYAAYFFIALAIILIIGYYFATRAIRRRL